jgi:peptidyl-prolyl cis-trans isomerase B (cyclophilin B)
VPSEKRARQRAAREARLEAERQATKRRKTYRNGAIIVVIAGVVVLVAFLLSNNNNNKPVQSQSNVTTTTTAAGKSDAALQAKANEVAVKAGCPKSPTTPTAAAKQTYTAAPPMTIDTSKTYTATFKTTTGTFEATLDASSAPQTVNNFVFLANKGYFNCGSFFRVIPGFVLQTGNPEQTNQGKEPGYTIPDELPPKAANPAQQYPLGSLVMANTGSPNTGGSQFFIVSGTQGEALPNTYSLFGQVTTGQSVVDTIGQQGSASGIPPKVTQRILTVTINES